MEGIGREENKSNIRKRGRRGIGGMEKEGKERGGGNR